MKSGATQSFLSTRSTRIEQYALADRRKRASGGRDGVGCRGLLPDTLAFFFSAAAVDDSRFLLPLDGVFRRTGGLKPGQTRYQLSV